MSINVVKSGVGNIGSIIRVINDLEYSVNIIDDPDKFNLTKKIILPGVGSFDSFIDSLKKNNLNNKIQDLVINHNYSILGICVGMQALFDSSEKAAKRAWDFLNIGVKNLIALLEKFHILVGIKLKKKKKTIYSQILKKNISILHIVFMLKR